MECRFAQFGVKPVTAAREYHPGGPWAVLEIAIPISRAGPLWPRRAAHREEYGELPFHVAMSFLSTSSGFGMLAMIFAYSGSGCSCDPFISSRDPNMTQLAHSSRLSSSAHLEIQPKYWLGSALVTI